MECGLPVLRIQQVYGVSGGPIRGTVVGDRIPHHGPRIELTQTLTVLAFRAATGARGEVLPLDIVAFRALIVVVVDVFRIGFFRMKGSDFCHDAVSRKPSARN